MDNLLANYGSSDDEEEEEQRQPKAPVIPLLTTPNFSEVISKTSSSIFSSLPPPKSSSSSSSLFNSLPPPKSNLPKPPQTLTNLSPPNIDDQEREAEEVEVGQHQQHQHNVDSESASKFGLKTSKPSSSLFSSLPPPKTHQSDSQAPQSSPIFSSLPPPKLHNSDSRAPLNHSSSSDSNTKRVVQFKLPINPFLKKSSKVADEDDDDDDDEGKERKRSEQSTQAPSVKSFLSSIPAPKNSVTLGALPSALGSGRRSILEADVPASNYNAVATEKEVGVSSNVENYEGQWVDVSPSNSLGTAGGQSEYAVAGGGDPSNWVSASENYVNYDTYGGYGNYGNYGHYESNWVDGSAATAASDVTGMAELAMRVPGKRGRNEVPQEIVEVKQDELIKNRPREDQVKLTGIAFGPAYQPVSTKGKPSKLHKRKHQIGSLLFDMKQKEMELAERRSKGFLTKAETQAKYGW